MNIRKIFGYGLIAVIFALAGCGDPEGGAAGPGTQSGDIDGGPAAITYTVAQDGGADGSANTTGIKFTFSAPVDGLTADNITVTDITGSVTKGGLSGSGDSRLLAVTVDSAGDVRVSIAKTGIEAGAKTVTVFKQGEIAPVLTQITADYNGTAPVYSNMQLDSLKANLTVTAHYSNGTTIALSANEYTLSGTLTLGTRTVTVTYQSFTDEFTVHVVFDGATYTVEQTGGANGSTDSTGIVFTFSESVSGLTAADITVGGKAAKASPASLTGSGTTWTLAITVDGAGMATVSINRNRIEPGEKSVTVYSATESVQTYTVTFNADGGSPAPQSQNVEEGGTVSEPETITKAGFVFEGWYKEANFINLWDFDTDPVTTATTIYAKWVEAFTVTFNSNGGSAETAQTVLDGGRVTRPTDPTRSGYVFAGWYKESSLTTLWNFATDTVTTNITLYAKWLTPFTVTFNSDGGSAVAPQTVLEGNTAVQPADPIKANAGFYAGTPSAYTFAGWRLSGAAYNFSTPVTSNITLTANWTTGASNPPIDLSSYGDYDILNALAYINDNNGTDYTLVLGADVVMSGYNGLGLGKNGVTLTITSVEPRVISDAMTDYYGAIMITVGDNGYQSYSNAKLVIDGYVTLQGSDNRDNPVVCVYPAATLELKGNAKIIGNTNNGDNAYSKGGGVNATGDSNHHATVIMSGNAEISGNTAKNDGGGVYLGGYADLTMSGNASIKGNTASDSDGGGVYISDNDTLTMSGNASIKSNTGNNGGGVHISGGTFTMSGNAAIENNSARSGGGVGMAHFVASTFTMNGGEISGNDAYQGGGVYIGYSWGEVGSQFIVASEQVKAGIKNNSGSTGPQVYKYDAISTFTVGGVPANTY